ncbi:MAG: tetratricopeptide repeat protein [Alphaproteobacteria bacterium]|nr:tetratricopeptide repeat protein [Alphaproteobacteria bacterium]MBV8407780.1 tetratricopeptide repeat protein [Alphaproteobacteria bacterium]
MIGAGVAAFVIVAAQACAQRSGSESSDPSGREIGRTLLDSGGANGPSEARGNNTLEALNKILSSPKLSAFDRSIYLSIRAYQLAKLGREADSQKDIAEMGKVLPTAWPLVLSGTLPELAGGGDRAAALRTLDSALQQKPGDSWLVIAQAQVYMQIADFQRAKTLLDEALQSASSAADRRIALYYRGHANFNLGNYAESADDFDATLEGRTGRARLAPILWRYAAQVRAHRDARGTLAKAVASEPLDEWPGPIVKFLLGRMPVGELEVLAESDEAAKRANGKCPSALFVGLDALRRGDRQQAHNQLQLAQARCPTMSEFNWAATSELKRL